MALFVLIGVLRGFPAAAYRRTPRRKPLCGLDQNKNCSFLNWTHNEGLQFFIIPIYLLQTPANKKNTHKIETKTDKADHRRKLL